jgi:hypothetical protein
MPDNLYLAWWNLENLFDVGPHPGHDEPSPRPSPGRRGSRSQRRLSPLLPPGEGAGG